MTDRDRFAAAALTGLLACPSTDGVKAGAIADQAFSYADSMLARKREHEAEVRRLDTLRTPVRPPPPPVTVYKDGARNPLPPPNPEDRSTIATGWWPWHRRGP